MEKGIVADSVSFYIRQPGEETCQQVDEYDWLESEGKAYYRRLGGCVFLFKMMSAISPGRIMVQGMIPEIFCPGPARPRMSPASTRTRFRVCSREPADSEVCGSSMMTSEGRTLRPSARLYFIPRTRPVIPATRTMMPEALLSLIVGNTISFDVHVIRVRSPW